MSDFSLSSGFNSYMCGRCGLVYALPHLLKVVDCPMCTKRELLSTRDDLHISWEKLNTRDATISRMKSANKKLRDKLKDKKE